jgi:WXG100 family type VII secretion target
VARTQAEAAVMEQTAAKFEGVNQSLQSMLTTLMGELQMLEKAWIGQGGGAFTQVKQAYEASQQKLQRALAETATAIRTSGQKYSASDSEAAGRVSATNANVTLPL